MCVCLWGSASLFLSLVCIIFSYLLCFILFVIDCLQCRPAHHAARNGHLDVMRVLLFSAGGKVKKVSALEDEDEDGKTPLIDVSR